LYLLFEPPVFFAAHLVQLVCHAAKTFCSSPCLPQQNDKDFARVFAAGLR
jgi:hypothetical protein